MHRKLTPQSSLENLKREAKRWLKALRDNDAEARARFERAYPKAPPEPTLRDVQHALALEYGLANWIALKEAIETRHGTDDARAAAIEALLRAANTGNVSRVAAVLDEYPDIVSERGVLDGHSGLRSALHFAVSANQVPVIKLLLDRGADPNVRDEGDNAMPLHFAAEKEQLEVITMLIEHGADAIGTGDDHELEIIGWASVFGKAQRDVIDYLLAHGARHNIYSAVATGDVEAIRRVASERPSDVDKPMDRTNHRRRPLHLAIVKKKPESLDALLEVNANPNVTAAAGLMPIDQAVLNGETRMAERLLAHGSELGLPAAIILGRDVERLLAENEGALRPGGRWRALIIRAAEQAPGDVIETLIRHGASVNVVDDEETSVDSTAGYTPLHAAAFNGNASAARVLLAHGANVTARDSKYFGTPAGWAAYAGHRQLRDLILEGPIDMFDAIYFDRVHRLREIFERDPGALNRRMRESLLREPGADEWTKSWWTPLAYAVINNKPDAVRVLLELGAETNPRIPDGKTLVDIARETDTPSIVSLLEEYAPHAEAIKSPGAELVARFLSNACPDHHVRGGPAHQVALHTAGRLLQRHPELASESIYTAVVCGNVDYVERAIAEHPDVVREKGGPKGSAGGQGMQFTVGATGAAHPKWEPLLYLCFTRLENRASNDNAVAIATMLLDAGANPNAYFMAGDSRYSPLTGVFGEGEEDRPPHPRREELTRLLLARGAEPYDIQVFYNIHFHGDVLWYLELVYEHTVKIGRKADWDDPAWSMIDMGGYGLGARYLLKIAIDHNNLELAEWILSHGADPNARLPERSKLKQRSLHEIALRAGYTEIADLLVRFGATPSGYIPNTEDLFVAAALRVDREEAERLVAEHPELLRSTKAIFEAATRDQPEAVRLLLDLGTPIEIEDESKTRPLHVAAWSDSVNTAKLLIEQQAEIDPVESNWGNSPLDFARYGQHQRMIDLLAPYSRDLWSLAFTGKVERLRELLTADPSLAKWTLSNGVTPLMRLPDDEQKALEIASLFLERGADPQQRNSEGLTAIDLAERRGLDEVVALLRRRVD
ncbi:MAG TPA: ankyrin repeat domain-containing protein [Gemmatimonadaceae bacterium]